MINKLKNSVSLKKMVIVFIIILTSQMANAQLIDWSKIDIKGLIGKAMTVKQGWAPKFKIGNLDVSKISKVAEIINLKNVNTATKLFKTFKTGRSVYKAGAYVGIAASAYSSIKNLIETNKDAAAGLTPAALQAWKDAKSKAITKAQNLGLAGLGTVGAGVIIKLLTKKAASKAAEAFNGAVKKKIIDIFSFDAPSASPYTSAGVALKINL